MAQNIAILGGGAGALAAAYFLSAKPDWRERYAITVYQQGWRLGGKGASGRNAQLGQRIEEHGLHIWFGCYANAFAMIRAVYAELERPADAPLARWDQAFRPHDYVALAEAVDGGWRPWHLVLPHRPGQPGTGLDPVTPWQLALAAIEWLPRWHSELRAAAPGRLAADVDASIAALVAQARALPADAHAHDDADRRRLRQALARVEQRVQPCALAGARVIEDDGTRRALIALNVATTILRGMLADGVFTRGFDAVNGEDFRAWLLRHGGDQELCVNAAPVLGLYSLLFAFEDGDPARPSLEAGTALRTLLRLGFAYRGSVMYRMRAGMGDAVFAPLYELLARRGVRFAFFHRVEEIVPEGDVVGTIRMTVQASVPGGDYRPLVDVQGLPCWPNRPDDGQLDPAQAALLQAHGVDLESWWSDWPALFRRETGKDLPQTTLVRGRDFDHVISGLPVDALALAAPGLLDTSLPLRATVATLRTTATQACQVWLDHDTRALGWTVSPGGQEPILTTFDKPYDTWAGMSQVLAGEAWPPEVAPASVQYFCGPMPQAGLPPRSDTGFPARAAVGGFPWHWLVDPENAEGPARFDRQYWRANVDPAERYVLSVPGSTARRLVSNGTGVANLYLAGDWLKTGLDCGCVEAAVMGGMQAARALSGYPKTILGENDGV